MRFYSAIQPATGQDNPPPGGFLLFGSRMRGFTLLELIVVIVLLGILYVYAAPRLFNTSDFDAIGFHGETQAYLRYAQKTAIAQRRTVCVIFSASSVTLTIASNAASYDCSAVGTLNGPRGESNPVTLNARPGVSFVATPANFNFDGLGRPITTAGAGAAQNSQTFQVNGVATTITVEAATGYIHE